MKIAFNILLGLLVLIWMLSGVCVASIGVYTIVINWLGLSCRNLIYTFATLTVFVLLLDIILRIYKIKGGKESD